MPIIDDILRRPEFREAPPVLVDVGASGGLNPAWEKIAKYATCIAFDADDRELARTRKTSAAYRQFHLYKRALSAGHEPRADFYLTSSPPCSSLLPPNLESLAAWEFADRFCVTEKATIPTIHIQDVIDELKLQRIDWFKTDSQGTDLRLFLSLGDEMVRKVLVAEFEPGILDAYVGEDKLSQVMACMDERSFWMSDIDIMGSSRLRKDQIPGFTGVERRYLVYLLRTSPGWAEVTYMNCFRHQDFTQRDFLLGWVFATLQSQHGFALELAGRAKQRFPDGIFERMEKHSLNRVRRSYLNLRAYLPLFPRVFRKWRKLGTLQFLHPAETAKH